VSITDNNAPAAYPHVDEVFIQADAENGFSLHGCRRRALRAICAEQDPPRQRRRTAIMSSTQTLLRSEAAAIYVREKFGIPCAWSWLAKLACMGGGPSYRLASHIQLYAPADFDGWATSRLSPAVKNTAEYESFPKKPQRKSVQSTNRPVLRG
jgi:hypothetical protein